MFGFLYGVLCITASSLAFCVLELRLQFTAFWGLVSGLMFSVALFPVLYARALFLVCYILRLELAKSSPLLPVPLLLVPHVNCWNFFVSSSRSISLLLKEEDELVALEMWNC